MREVSIAQKPALVRRFAMASAHSRSLPCITDAPVVIRPAVGHEHTRATNAWIDDFASKGLCPIGISNVVPGKCWVPLKAIICLLPQRQLLAAGRIDSALCGVIIISQRHHKSSQVTYHILVADACALRPLSSFSNNTLTSIGYTYIASVECVCEEVWLLSVPRTHLPRMVSQCSGLHIPSLP